MSGYEQAWMSYQTGYEPASTFRPIPVQDGYIMVAAVSPRNLQTICEVLGRPGDPLPFPDRGEQTLALLEKLAAWSSGRRAAECEALLGAEGVPVAKYQSPAEILQNEHLRSQGAFAEMQGATETYLIDNAPFRFQSARSGIQAAAPALGEQQQEILSSWLGADGCAAWTAPEPMAARNF